MFVDIQEEKNKRIKVLQDIKLRAMRHRGKIKTISRVGYVLGRYNPNNGLYEYLTGTKYNTTLLSATINNNDKHWHREQRYQAVKGCKYSTSKVFYTITIIASDINWELSTNMITSVTLTKPNHYEMLSAVVNNI